MIVRLDRGIAQPKQGIASARAGNLPFREVAPPAAEHILIIFGRPALPILNLVIDRVGLGPKDSQPVDGYVLPEIDQNPLGIERVIFACVKRVEVGVAFPEASGIAVGKTGVAIVIGLILGIAPAGKPEAV